MALERGTSGSHGDMDMPTDIAPRNGPRRHATRPGLHPRTLQRVHLALRMAGMSRCTLPSPRCSPPPIPRPKGCRNK